MLYWLETTSKTTGQRCYYDGHGFSLTATNARTYSAESQSEAEDHAQHVSALFNGHDVQAVDKT